MTHETDWVGPGNKSFSITQGKEGGGGGGGAEGQGAKDFGYVTIKF